MLKRLLAFLGISGKKKKPVIRTNAVPVSPEPVGVQDDVVQNEDTIPAVTPEQREFLLKFEEPYEPCALQDLSHEDRLFVSGIVRMLNENRFEIPVLPQAALEISRLISNPLSSTQDFSTVLARDPTLSLNVLRTANSAYYGCAIPAKTLHDAIFRIGINQIKTIVLLTHLHAKILQGGVFQQQAKWLSDLSVALAHLAQSLAPDLGMQPEAAFTRGMLYHIDHFLVMGIVSEVSRQHRTRICPSEQGLREAIGRFGKDIKDRTMREWGLEDLLSAQQDQDSGPDRFSQLRCSLIAHWTGEDFPREVAGIPPDRLSQALERVPLSGVVADQEQQ